MSQGDRRTDTRRWRPRPLPSFALRLVSVLVPAAAGAATVYLYVLQVPMPDRAAIVPWSVGLVVASTIATALAERVGRRFLPLAVLLKLSLVFPDRAPSRFVMARGAGNVKHLERRIHDAREGGVDEEPVRAAEQILSLVAALSAHDRKTRGHSERVRAFTDLLASQLRIQDEDRDRLRWAALIHDIGKLHVPARILNKPGRPEPRDWERLKAHPAAGARIARPLLSWLGPWGDAIEQHHERFDGGGYPNGLEREGISLAARIVSVADSFEVMTAARSYKRPMSVPAARRELAACAGEQFDPAIVRAFLNASLGRLWWTVGLASWTALLPVLGPVQRAGGQIAGAARTGAAAAVVSAGGMLPMFAGIVAPDEPPVHARSSPEVDLDRAGDDGGPDRKVPQGVTTVGQDRDRPAGGGGDGTDPGTGTGGGTGGSGEDPEDPNVVGDTVETVDQVVDGLTDGVGEGVDGLIDATDAVKDTTVTVTDVVGGLLTG